MADWLASGRTYASLTRLAFQRQLAYRFANLSGLVTPALRLRLSRRPLSRRPLSMKPAESAGVTNGFFGLLRAYVIIALFGARPAVAGYSIRDAITYTGLAQALIAYLALWGWWDLMRSIRTGEVASDLSRPLDYFGYWCAQDCGRAAAQLLVRGLPIMVLYAIFFHISLPPTLHHWLALLTSLGLAWLVSFSWRFIVSLSAFWTQDAVGVGRMGWMLTVFLSGFLMPVAFLPDWMQTLMRFTFFPSMINTIFSYGGSAMFSYPMHIYADWMRRFFIFVVPGALLVYYPALFFLGKPDPLGLPPIMQFLAPLAGFGVLAVAFAFWNFGVRKYTSTGT